MGAKNLSFICTLRESNLVETCQGWNLRLALDSSVKVSTQGSAVPKKASARVAIIKKVIEN